MTKNSSTAWSNLNSVDANGETPLDLAENADEQPVAGLLISRGARTSRALKEAAGRTDRLPQAGGQAERSPAKPDAATGPGGARSSTQRYGLTPALLAPELDRAAEGEVESA